MTNKHILYATDLTEEAVQAVLHIKPLVKKLNSKVSLIHVVRSYLKDWFSSGHVELHAEQRLKHWLEILSADGAQAGDIFITIGNVADSILSQAEEIGADMIMIGAGKKSFLDRHLTATTAETVVRHARQTVWVHKDVTFNGMHKVVCGVDLSASSKIALEKALDLCQTFGARLDILFVIKEPNYEAIGIPIEIEKERLAKYKEQKHQELIDFLTAIDFKDVEHTEQVRWGSAARTILGFANDGQADMIVLGAKGTGNLKHVLMGSTSERVLRTAPCSLLIVR